MISDITSQDIHIDPVVKTRQGNNARFCQVYCSLKEIQHTSCDRPLVSPYGISMKYAADGGKLTLDLTVDENVRAWGEMVDALIIKTAQENCVDWFGSVKSVDELTAMYSPLIRQSNPAYSPTIRMKVHRNNQNIIDYDSKAALTPCAIKKGSTVVPVCSLGSIWFMGRHSFGITLNASRLAVISVEPSEYTWI